MPIYDIVQMLRDIIEADEELAKARRWYAYQQSTGRDWEEDEERCNRASDKKEQALEKAKRYLAEREHSL
jgi:hypothetical protein